MTCVKVPLFTFAWQTTVCFHEISNFFFSAAANLNIHGDSPPPKEVPDMSSATFVSVVSCKIRFHVIFSRLYFSHLVL